MGTRSSEVDRSDLSLQSRIQAVQFISNRGSNKLETNQSHGPAHISPVASDCDSLSLDATRSDSAAVTDSHVSVPLLDRPPPGRSEYLAGAPLSFLI